MALVQYAYQQLKKMKNVELYTPEPVEPYFAPLFSFNVQNVPSEVVAQELNSKGVAVRAGLHCAPAAHECMGTIEQGTVRVCPSIFSNMNEMHNFVLSLMQIIRKLS